MHDETNLCPSVPGKRFNTSILKWQDGYLFAFRTGWAGSDIYVVRMTRDWTPIGDAVKLHLNHPDCSYGREDPRLFIFRGRVHVWFIGVTARNRHLLATNVLYARLADDFSVEDIWHPVIPNRQPWEKNIALFEHDDQLWGVYSIAPHRILAIDGNKAAWAHRTDHTLAWSGGEPRGGASPVIVGDRFYHWFHSRSGRPGHVSYEIGCYSFEAKPPFRINGWMRSPFVVANRATLPAGQKIPIIFPCGAIHDDTHWLVSSGEHDRWSRIDRFPVSSVNTAIADV